MQIGFHEYGAETEFQALTQKIMRVIKQRGGEASTGEITRAISTVKYRDIRETLETLVEAGSLIAEAVANKKGGPKSYNYRIP